VLLERERESERARERERERGRRETFEAEEKKRGGKLTFFLTLEKKLALSFSNRPREPRRRPSVVDSRGGRTPRPLRLPPRRPRKRKKRRGRRRRRTSAATTEATRSRQRRRRLPLLLPLPMEPSSRRSRPLSGPASPRRSSAA